MKEVWFFLIRNNTDYYVKDSYYYDSFEEAREARNSWQRDNIHEEPITPVMKGYVKYVKRPHPGVLFSPIKEA